MNDELRKVLTGIAKKKYDETFEPTDDDLRDMLVYGETVFEGEMDKHRWITYFVRVVELDGMFFQFVDAYCSGDNSLEDQGYEWDWQEVKQVFPKEVKAIEYVTKEELDK